VTTDGLLPRVAATDLLVAGEPLVVGVSGGRDSLCLLGLAAELVGVSAVLAVHVHHGLRGAAADGDALAAADAARRLGVAARVVRLRVPAAVAASPSSPAVWARDARKAALRAAADAWGGPAAQVAVAHTASDQAETVLLRAISSPGARSLAGMAVRDVDRGVVRPLLAAGVTRAETGAWCTAHGLRWRDDATNATGPRGRVRSLLEGLEAVDGRAVRALTLTADRAREDDAALRAAAVQLLAPSCGGVARDALAAAPSAVGRRALRALAEAAVGRPCPRVGARLEDVLGLRAAAGAGAAMDLGDGVRATLRDGCVRCTPSPPRS
jgi:tRNA(Ile)-lysidine synthase